MDKPICYGQTDVSLSDTFDDEVLNVFRKLPENLSDHQLFSSPLTRCKKLADRIGEPIFVEELKELNFGEWELSSGSSFSEKQLDHWQREFSEFN